MVVEAGALREHGEGPLRARIEEEHQVLLTTFHNMVYMRLNINLFSIEILCFSDVSMTLVIVYIYAHLSM